MFLTSVIAASMAVSLFCPTEAIADFAWYLSQKVPTNKDEGDRGAQYAT